MAGVLISNLEYFAQAESKANKRPNSLSDKVGNSRGFWSPSLSFPSCISIPISCTAETFVGPAVRAAVRVLLWHLPRCIYHLARTKGPLSPNSNCNSNSKCSQPASHLARNELCIDFLFAILTALTLFPSGGGGGVAMAAVAEATLRQRQTK